MREPKGIILGICAVVIAIVAGLRIRDAWREPPGGGDERTGSCKRIRVEVERKAPEHPSFPGHKVVRQEQPPATPHLRLATLRHSGTVEAHRRVLGDFQRNYDCVVAKAGALGANGIYVERVDDQVAGLPIGQGEIVEVAYLLHAGSVPAPLREALAGRACMVTEIFAGESAERSGLRVGDLLVRLEGTTAGPSADPCAITTPLRAVPPGGSARLVVQRDGGEQTLTMAKQGDRFGYAYQAVPILDPAALAP